MHRFLNGHQLRILGCILLLLFIAHPAAANQPPRAVAAASILPDGTPESSVRLLVGPTPGAAASWTVRGGGSYDPDGDPLTYQWTCWDGNGNKCLFPTNATNVTDIHANFPAGSYTFSLTVKDPSSASSTDTAQVQVLVDNVAPQVIPPEEASISSSEIDGARASDSSDLNQFLFEDPYAKDPLGLQFFFTALPPQVSGVDVDTNTVIPAGTTTTVTFRFADAFGNIGSATADVFVAALQTGDLLVGGALGSAGNNYGAIYLIRNGQVSTFCESPPSQSDPDFWNVPGYVTVDSKGRIVFLAYLAANQDSADFGLLRCTAPGEPAEKLAIFPRDATFVSGWPVPFPGRFYLNDGNGNMHTGLHLQRTKKIVIDDAVNGGQPTPVTQESYVFAANPGTIESLSLRTDSLAWVENEISPVAVTIGGVHPVDRLPEMFFHSKMENVTLPIPPAGVNVRVPVAKTYVTGGFSDTLRRIHQPLSLDVTATIPSLGTLRFVLELFGVHLEVSNHLNNALADDVTVPNGSSGCPPTVPPIRADWPGGLPLTSFFNIIYEEDAGLVLKSNHGGYPSDWIGKVSEALINLDMMDDQSNYVQNLVACAAYIHAVVEYEPLTSGYHVDPQTGETTDYLRTAAAHDGLYATQSFQGRVVKLNLGSKNLSTVANVPGASGIAAFPPQLGNVQVSALVIRIDSPVDVLVTDPFGRRLGMVDGQVINEFGTQGFDSGPQSEPRFYVFNHPSPGDFAVQSIGTGSAPFTVHAYSVDTSQLRAEHIFVTGNASPGVVGKHDLTLDTAAGIAFKNTAPFADAGGDQTVTADATGNATVALDGSGSSDPDGDTLSFTWGGPFGVLAGASVNVSLPGGVHLLALTVEDGRGGSAEDTVQITVDVEAPPTDTTPPVLTLPANLTVETTSPSGAAVSYGATADDAVDGAIMPVCSPASGATFALGTTTVNCYAADLSDNSSSGSFSVTVQDTTPPSIGSVTASPKVLRPPNHRMVSVSVAATAADAGDAAPDCQIISVTSNERVSGRGAGNTAPDWVITGPLSVDLRAERSVIGRGRIYTNTVRCADASGNSSTRTVTVTVPYFP